MIGSIQVLRLADVHIDKIICVSSFAVVNDDEGSTMAEGEMIQFNLTTKFLREEDIGELISAEPFITPQQYNALSTLFLFEKRTNNMDETMKDAAEWMGDNFGERPSIFEE